MINKTTSRNWSKYLNVLGPMFLSMAGQAATPPGLSQIGKEDVFSMPASVNLQTNITLSGSKKKMFPLSAPKNFYGLSISADVELLDKNSLARVVLIDPQQHEYLVYETYPALVDSSRFSVQNVCEETCSLPLVPNTSLRIELEKASLVIRGISYNEVPMTVSTSVLKEQQDNTKIQKINTKNLGWVAGKTSISQLFFDEKRKLFLNREVPNLQGFEYYRGGIFRKGVVPSSVSSSSLVEEFDWRNRHGENWLTSVKNQLGCGSCWAFAATGATEALTNLYFNQHLDLDLAEQDALSCSGAGSCWGGWPGLTLDYFTHTGVVDEGCFPYSATDEPCGNKCVSPKELIKISGKVDFEEPKTDENLKRLIIEYGPISGGIFSWSHAMTLVGFRKDDGETTWIFKNSWGDWGVDGYAYVQLDIHDIGWSHALKSPIISARPYTTQCVDQDSDGFCNWGISAEKPSSCPLACKPEKDCDDSNAKLGPFEADYSCRILEEEEKGSCLGLACTIYSSKLEAVTQGTNGDDVICGNDGNNIILGKGGNDTICGGVGDDVILAGDGHDRVNGGAGNDILDGGAGIDMLDGDLGNDILMGTGDKDALYGNQGDDYLSGGSGSDLLNGGPDNDNCEKETSSSQVIFCENAISSTEMSVQSLISSGVMPAELSAVVEELKAQGIISQ